MLTGVALLMTFSVSAQSDAYEGIIRTLVNAESFQKYFQEPDKVSDVLHILDNGVVPADFEIKEGELEVKVSSMDAIIQDDAAYYMEFKKLKIKGNSYKVKYRFGDLKASMLYKNVDGTLKRVTGIYAIVEKDDDEEN
jgi:hypothetical protein